VDFLVVKHWITFIVWHVTMWLMCDKFVTVMCDITLTPNLLLTLSLKNKIKWEKKIEINQVYHLQFWHYPSFKISSWEKLASIFASSFLTSSNTLFWTSHHLICTTSLLYTFPVIPSSKVSFFYYVQILLLPHFYYPQPPLKICYYFFHIF